jgi:hypothetical protein
MALTMALLAPIPGAFADGQKTLASTLEVYVFPTEGQNASQQSKDEAECYGWAVENTGDDPFDLAKQAAETARQAEQDKQQARDASRGAGAKGVVGGAAAGAVIGEVASDDAGKGAAYGAAAGLIASRRRARQKQNQAAARAEHEATEKKEATTEQLENFKKAFSVCLEAKDYLVKY